MAQVEAPIRSDPFGNWYFSLEMLAALESEHPLWVPICQAARDEPALEPFTTRHTLLAVIEDDVCAGFQFSPGLSQVLGCYAVRVRPIDDEGTIMLSLWNRVMALWHSPIGHCSSDQQHICLQRFLLDEVWVHHLVYSDYGIELPDETYRTDRVPSWRRLRRPMSRRLCQSVVWMPGNDMERAVSYTYDASVDQFIQKVLDT